MDNTVTIFGKTYPIVYYKASVFYANRYDILTATSLNNLEPDCLYVDVIFRDDHSNTEWPVVIRGEDLSFYTGQEVYLICVNEVIIAYIDIATNRYHFTTSDLSRTLELGLSYKMAWLIGAMAAMAILFIASSVPYALLLLFLVPFCAYFQKQVLHQAAWQALDGFIREH